MIAADPRKIHDQWQRLDPQVGLVMPWYTHPALDEIVTWDLTDKTVFEWGGGCSSLWWASRARFVHTVEAHQPWADWISTWAGRLGLTNLTVERRWPDPIDKYLAIEINDLEIPVDIICVDGSERTACLQKALTLPRPLMIICDNWQQDGVYIDPEAETLMKPFDGKFFIQPDHTDHQGRPWQTAIWRLS